MQRRSILKLSAGLAASGFALGCASAPVPVPGNRRLEKFGLQLSTVTQLMLQDFEGTLALAAEVGYSQVEFSAMGFLGRPVSLIQSKLAELSLEAPVGRISPALPDGFFSLPRAEARQVFGERARPEHLMTNVRYGLEAATTLGQSSLVLPALMRENFQTLDQVKANIEMMNQAGELCAAAGVKFGYHNHDWELKPVAGVVPYDLMIEQTDADKVTFQLDAYWITKGGGNLADYLSRYAGRFSSCHMKDIDAQGDFADVGDGLIDFPAFTRQALAQGAQYFFVERDGPPNPAQSIARSHAYLSQMTF